MRHGSLFSGIGGFDLAAEWMGWTNVFHCEWNEFGQRVLKHYWPDAISYGDITKTDFTVHRGDIDILTGGFPCQPYSMAGKRKGKEDERHLWPEMLRVIREIKPTWVVGENVFGITNWDGGVVFNEVQTDLEAEGYEVQPYVLPACAVNAPHRRDRVWFVSRLITNGGGTGFNGDSKSAEGCNGKRERFSQHESDTLCSIGVTPDTVNSGDSTQRGGVNGERQKESIKREQSQHESDRPCYKGASPDTESKRYSGINTGDEEFQPSQGQRLHGRSSIGFSQRTNWQDFPTVSPLCDRNDGLSDRLSGITFSKWRNESIKAMGNAIVPQVVFQIFKAIEQFNKQSHDTIR